MTRGIEIEELDNGYVLTVPAAGDDQREVYKDLEMMFARIAGLLNSHLGKGYLYEWRVKIDQVLREPEQGGK